jgi:O-antigen/teichoic acid export membrane protein
LNLVLVLSYGINGAVIATLVVNIYYFMHMLFLYKKKEGYVR